eukprot:CAMPEP_0194359976 /NCGR_PEP_ID=MMETSP0174-20130528/7275_1 /TAXON_ID=216777 /ORGANISM="Proboscia alata, Strain PI-D3" /LENGTH=334 /DNA_ID=CAMNT_0039131199 /DNA_START=59 /DNA_END=1063 /DNA_ORIENTATION=-
MTFFRSASLLVAFASISISNTDAYSTMKMSMKKHMAVGGGGSSPWGRPQKRGNGKNTLVMMPQGVPMVPWQPQGQDYAQFIDVYSRLYRDRIIVLRQFIDESQANEIIATLLYLQNEDPAKEITLYINIPGALLRPAMAVFDSINRLKEECPVSTLNLGLATGMGALLCGAGTRGKRAAMPNSRFLLQRIGAETAIQGQATDIGLEVRNMKQCNDRLERELAKMTGHPIAKIKNDMKRDFYLSSDEAVAYGLIDRVILPLNSGIRTPVYTTDPVTGEEVLQEEPEVGLGVFGGPDVQRYQDQHQASETGTGWRDEDSSSNDDDEDDIYEPPTQK